MAYCFCRYPLFQQIDERVASRFHEAIRTTTYRTGESVLQMDDAVTSFYVVKEGRLKMVRYSTDGKEHFVRLLQQGDVFGQEWFESKRMRTTVIALQQTTCCVIDAPVVESCLQADVTFAMNWMRRLVSEQMRTEERLWERDVLSVKERIVRYLQEEQTTLTQTDIANYVGATRETVNRILRQLEQECEKR